MGAGGAASTASTSARIRSSAAPAKDWPVGQAPRECSAVGSFHSAPAFPSATPSAPPPRAGGGVGTIASMVRSLQALLLLALLGGCRRPVPVTPPPPTARPAAEPAAVRLLVIDFDTLALTEASAFPVSTDGLLATCAHVVAAGTPLGVAVRDGRRATVTEVVATDVASDVALCNYGRRRPQTRAGARRHRRHGPHPRLPDEARGADGRAGVDVERLSIFGVGREIASDMRAN